MKRVVTIALLILLLSACTAIPTKGHNTGERTRSIVEDAIRGYRQHDRQAVIDILIAILAAPPSSALHTPAHAQTEGAEQTVAAPQLTGAVKLERLAIELSWNAVTGADHYELRKLHGNDCPAWEQVDRVAKAKRPGQPAVRIPSVHPGNEFEIKPDLWNGGRPGCWEGEGR